MMEPDILKIIHKHFPESHWGHVKMATWHLRETAKKRSLIIPSPFLCAHSLVSLAKPGQSQLIWFSLKGIIPNTPESNSSTWIVLISSGLWHHHSLVLLAQVYITTTLSNEQLGNTSQCPLKNMSVVSAPNIPVLEIHPKEIIRGCTQCFLFKDVLCSVYNSKTLGTP